jgi:hypothetical protein
MRDANKYTALMLCLFLPMAAQADTFRCDGQIIEQGMNQDQVLQYCGQPDETNNQVRISWTYKRQAGEMDIVIYFYANGDIEEIESQRQ